MIKLVQNKQDYNNDLRAMLMAFYPGIKIVQTVDSEDNIMLTFKAEYEEEYTVLTLIQEADFTGVSCSSDSEACGAPLGGYMAKSRIQGDYRDKKVFRNSLKLAAYKLLSCYTGRKLPWGDLTGVRPTKIAMSRLSGGASFNDAVNYYIDVYDVSKKKAGLATGVAKRETELIKSFDLERDYCLYVGIPFCPSRCLYCSFTSYPIGIYRDKAELYIERLKSEITAVRDMLSDDRRLVSIYVGGGTPTAINEHLLDELFSHIENTFDTSFLKEYTVEAGRPDSITREKLQVLKKYGVTRISINPQTMNDATLKVIGRAHTSLQTKEAFLLARQCGFDNINMDIIAGLPGEDIACMEYTLGRISKLEPESITVHSLAIKRAANLNQQMEEFAGTIHHDTDLMLDLVAEKAAALGMEPYYLYRQKNIGGNLENVGYAKSGCECLYNILIMEELTDIISVGAGASTKLIFHRENRVERVENCKSVDDYINRIDEMIERKRALLNE